MHSGKVTAEAMKTKEVKEVPPEIEDDSQTTVNELFKMDLGEKGNPKPIYVSALLSEQERSEYFNLLQEFKNYFAWTYHEMLGLDLEVALHKLAMDP